MLPRMPPARSAINPATRLLALRGSVPCHHFLNPLNRELPRFRNLLRRSGRMSARSPRVFLVQNAVAPTVCRFPQSLSDFCRRSQVNPRQCIQGYIAELHKAEDRSLSMPCQPVVDRAMIVRSLFLQVRLRKAPPAILAALNRDFQEVVPLGNDQVIFRLIRPVLDRDIEATPRELRGSDRFRGYSNIV